MREEEIPSKPNGGPASESGGEEPVVELHAVNPADWAGTPEPDPREEIVPDYILDETTTSMSGDGGTGKSLLAHQLLVARALHREWIGLMPKPGATLYLSCEDDLTEMRRRQYRILGFYDSYWSDLGDNARLVDLVGEDSVLALLKEGIIQPTPMYHALDRYMASFKPGLTVIDVLAAVFAGNEIVRVEVRQFANLLNRLCKKHKSAILLLAHPSLAGMSSGTGLSGSTDWNNGFRCRCYFEATGDKDVQRHVFRGMKNNYGVKGGKIDLEWRNGLYVPVKQAAKVESVAPPERIEALFMTLLRQRIEEGRSVSDRVGPNYAPAAFSGLPQAIAGKIGSKQLALAMERLFSTKQIHIETDGPPTRQKRWIAPMKDLSYE